MDAIALKAVCAFAKWFTQYEKLPFMIVFGNYQAWRIHYAGYGISHELAYKILSKLLNSSNYVQSKNKYRQRF